MGEQFYMILATLCGVVELRLALRRAMNRVAILERRVHALETPKPDSWRHPIIAGAGMLLVLLSLTGCSSAAAPTPRAILDQVRDDQVAAELAATPAGRRVATAAATATAAQIPAAERLEERHHLLRDAVAAIAVVSLCLVGARWFPLLGWILKPLGAAAGLFAAGVFALRSLLIVPEWLTLSVLGAVGAAVLAITTIHAKRAAHAANELATSSGIDVAALSGKARRFLNRARDWRAHHLPAKG